MKHSQYLNLELPLLNKKTITLFKKLSNSLSNSNSINLQKDEYDEILNMFIDKPDFDSYYIFKNPMEVLNASVIEQFEKLSLKVYTIILFGKIKKFKENKRVLTNRGLSDSLLHSDIYFDEKSNFWKPYVCGINSEIETGFQYFHWWKSKNLKELYPGKEETKDPVLRKLSGIHFESRSKYFNDPFEHFDLLEKKLIDNQKATLVRTDIPHSISYASENKLRFAISIRFHPDSFKSWEHALEIFKPLYETNNL
jgi:hypothetical protein